MSSYGRKSKLSLKALLQTLDNVFNTVFYRLKPSIHALQSYRIRSLSWSCIFFTNQEMGCTVLHVLIRRKSNDFMETFAANSP